MAEFSEIDSAISSLPTAPQTHTVDELLRRSEQIIENWLIAHGLDPTYQQKEGFRLLALHRQGAKFDPTFNACRETCREIAYYSNLLRIKFTQQRADMSAMLAKHLLLFVQGKLEEAQLGEFCCSSKPIRYSESES